MKNKTLLITLGVILLEGFAAWIFYLCIPSEAASARLLGLSLPRLLIAAAFLLGLAVALILWLRLLTFPVRTTSLTAKLDEALLTHSWLKRARLILVLAFIFLIELFLLTYISLPPFLQPILIWLALTALECWLTLRFSYAQQFGSLGQFIMRCWRSLDKTQRQVFALLAIIGLLYFCVFIPLNARGWNDPNFTFMSGVDEGIQYPIAVSTLTPGSTFASSVYHFMVNESDVYGHPYVALEALILLPSRLIFGADFGTHLQLNLFLLRMFITVLPYILCAFLLTWLVTRFRSKTLSIAAFLLLLSVPGAVKFQIRFLHPDTLLLFLVVCTIFFMQRDRFRYSTNLYLAAVTCSLAAVIKLWGFFFVLAFAGYLLTGCLRKHLSFGKMLLTAGTVLGVMLAAALISDPGLLVPTVTRELINGLIGQIQNRSIGYGGPGSEIYAKGLSAWMPFFESYYLQAYYFFFTLICLLYASLFSEHKLTARILLAWTLVTGTYLIYFVAAKSFWYLLYLLVPLYALPFLLLTLPADDLSHRWQFLRRPWVVKATWALVLLFCSSQFVINIITIINSPLILTYAR